MRRKLVLKNGTVITLTGKESLEYQSANDFVIPLPGAKPPVPIDVDHVLALWRDLLGEPKN